MAESITLTRAIYRFLSAHHIPVTLLCPSAQFDHTLIPELSQLKSDEFTGIQKADQSASYRLIMECSEPDPVFRYYRAGPVPPYRLAVMNWPFRQPETRGNSILLEEGLAVSVSLVRWQKDLLRHCSGDSPGKNQYRQLGFGF